MSRQAETERQLAVMDAWRSTLPSASTLDNQQACWPAIQAAKLATDAAGLRAYQLNAQATSQRVLASTYPTMAAMLGTDTLDMLARLLWQTQPPNCGDLGQWGGHLADLLNSHPDLQDWPWLADSARLDWAVHLSERAHDTTVDTDSLQRLGDTAPQNLRLHLQPHVHILTSAWPVASLWTAHRLDSPQQEDAARSALQAGSGETAVVWRHDWHGQVQVQGLPAPVAAWMQQVAGEHDLATLLNQADGDFDFTAWLTEALTKGWLWRITSAP
ncbi:MAG: putative DNA-binding domain-containing protein [Aquabacterium sp.]|nr:putative DNA-binding domain-containing protein [Aquabacterium sp.]